MGGQIRGGVVQKAVVRNPRTKKAPAISGCVETRGSGDPLFFVGSGETGPKTRCANQIDCSRDVVGEYAEGGFGFDSIETSGEEAPACCHSTLTIGRCALGC
jgi:hypothetical protein